MEDFLRSVRCIKIFDSSMVATNNEVAATKIFPAESGENRFPGTAVARVGLKGAHNYRIRIINPILYHNLVSVHNSIGLEVAGFFGADYGANKESIGIYSFECRFLDKLMAAVGDIASVKTNNCSPVKVSKYPTGLFWS